MKKRSCLIPFRYYCVACILLASSNIYANGNTKNAVNATVLDTKEAQGSMQEKNTISGIILDEVQEPIIGASVVVKGTTKGTLTDFDGSFSIDVKEGETLVITYLGFISQEIKIATQKELQIILKENVTTLDDIVVMGYGASAKKKDLSMAISTVKIGDENLGRPSNVASMLQGTVPGMAVTQSGDPTKSASFNIRGKGNKDGDQILFVVDGVVGAPYNPSDVETITVLKDAASTALYGAAAGSGGVILITTKQAAAGKTRVTANVWMGLQEVWKKPKVLNASEFNQVWATATAAAGKELPQAYDPRRFAYGDVTRTNWVDEVFRTGQVQHYDVTVSGGSESIKALASLSYTDTKGTIITTFSKDLSARMNIDFQLAKWAKLSQKLNYTHTNGKGGLGQGHTGALFSAMAYPRSATVYESVDGKQMYGGVLPRWAVEQGLSVEADLQNPVGKLRKIRVNNPIEKVFSNTSLDLKLGKGISFKTDFSYSVEDNRYERFQEKFIEPGKKDEDNYREIDNTRFTEWYWDNVLSYTAEFDSKHYLSAMLGYTMTQNEIRVNRTRMQGFPNESETSSILHPGGQWNIDSDANKVPEMVEIRAMISALARVAYTYDDRYIFTGSIRRDATSKILDAGTQNYKFFPAVSAAWKITSEPYMPKLGPVNFAKLRIGWGQVGSVSSLPIFATRAPFASMGRPIYFGGANVLQNGIGILSIANKDLRWETTEQLSIGLDLGLLNDNLNFSVDYFNKKTDGVLERKPRESTAGLQIQPYGNIGDVENKGWEFTGDYKIKVGEVNLTAGGNISIYKSEVKSLGGHKLLTHEDGNTQKVGGLTPLRSQVGQPWLSYHLIESMGVFQSQAEVDNYTWYNAAKGKDEKIQPNAQAGDLKFKDFNGDGKINDEDRQFMGAYDSPDFYYGFNLGATWKGFSINALFQGVSGVKVFNGMKALTQKGQNGWNMSTDVLSAYNFKPNSGIPRLAVSEDANENYGKTSSYFLEKGDYLRLKSLNIGYELPRPFLNTLKLNGSAVRVYMNADNLFTLTSYKGFDPEVGNNGVDNGIYPVARSVSFGVNVSF